MAKQLIQAEAPEAPQYSQGDIVTNDKGDRLQLSGDQWLPIERALTQEQQQLAQASPLEAMGRAAVERGRSLYGGAQQLLSGLPDAAPDLAQQAMATRQSAQDRMRGLEQGNPNAAMIGGFLPDVAAGLGVAAATGGAGLPVMLGAEAALGGAMGAATTPDTPWQGAAIGAGSGMAVPLLGRALAVSGRAIAPRMMDRVLGKVDEVTASPVPAAGIGGQTIEEFTQQAEGIGLKVPLSVRTQSQALENLGMTLESSPITSWAVGGAQRHNQEVLEQAARKAAGLAPDSVMSKESLRIARDQAGKEFESFLDGSSAAMTKDDIRTLVEGSISDSFVNRGQYLKKVDSLLNDFKGDTLTSKDLHKLQTAMDDLASKGAKGSRKEKQAARQAVIEKLAPSQGTDPNLFRAAQQKWAALSAIEKSVGPRGSLRVGSLAKNLQGGDTGTPIAELGNISQAMNYMRPSAYGTENARRGGLTGTVMTGYGIGALLP